MNMKGPDWVFILSPWLLTPCPHTSLLTPNSSPLPPHCFAPSWHARAVTP